MMFLLGVRLSKIFSVIAFVAMSALLISLFQPSSIGQTFFIIGVPALIAFVLEAVSMNKHYMFWFMSVTFIEVIGFLVLMNNFTGY